MMLLGDHLWQSTLFAAVAALLTLALRRNRAGVRYGIWLAASVKFLVPFAALVTIGSQFGWRSSADIVVQPEMTLILDAISQPFSRSELAAAAPATASPGVAPTVVVLLFAIWLCGCALRLLAWRVRWQRLAAVVREAAPVNDGRELGALRRLEGIVGIRRPIRVVSSDTSLEPGVFGILRPVLVWPRGIGQRLSDLQVEAILAHELCHVRRRDNLAAALHMAVEALFWFHPLVWWLEKRLVDEREQACDEEVIRLGSAPQVYAESIVKMCEFCIESPFCAAGVTGSDLKRRVETIMRNHARERLNIWKRFLLATAGVVAVAGPMAVGVLNAPRLRAQSQPGPDRFAFEVASITPNESGDRTFARDPNARVSRQAGGICASWGWIRPSDTCFRATNITLRELTEYAFGESGLVPPLPQIFGGPDWIDADRFDVVARATGNAPLEPSGRVPLAMMVRTLLAQRFRLVVHHESRALPVYELLLARSDRRIGPRLRPATADCIAQAEAFRAALANANTEPLRLPSPHPCILEGGQGYLKGGAIDMSQLARNLSNRLNRVVRDQTGLAGMFDIDFTWTSGPALSIPAALQEQLGLKLELQQGPVDVLVIDGAEHPTPD